MIEANKICCKIGYNYLLRDITWRVRPNEHWVVFGLNGSGKTTLLSVISGFRKSTSGKLKVFGEEYNNENILTVRSKIGWVSASFFDKYYTRESALNIVLSGKTGSLGLNTHINLADVKRAKEILAELNLGDKVDYTFDMFSKGERQNILIARALLSEPEILILDEPCTGLDVYNRSCLFSKIEELSKKKKMSIIYVTHYLEEILPLFKQALLLKNGRTFAVGKTEELFQSDMVSKLIGCPVEVEKGADHTYRLGKSSLADKTWRF